MGMRYNNLAAKGLTNRDSEDYGVLASAKAKIDVLVCYSFTCCGSKNTGALKPHATSPEACPDCNQRLFWKKVIPNKYGMPYSR